MPPKRSRVRMAYLEGRFPPTVPVWWWGSRATVQAALDELMYSRHGAGGIEFVNSEATLTAQGKHVLARVGQQLGKLTAPTVLEIHVHTFCNPPCASDGEACQLLLLSRRRCDALAKTLSEDPNASRGTSKLQYRSIPWGCREPLVRSKKFVRFVCRADETITV
jgi:hypothetical protein